jgi:hypothetical protein
LQRTARRSALRASLVRPPLNGSIVRQTREIGRVGYYMRYIVADDRPVALIDVRTAFAEGGAAHQIDGDEAEATISYEGKAIGHVTLNVPGDGLFDDERDELIEFAQEGEDESAKERVVDALRAALDKTTGVVCYAEGPPIQPLALLQIERARLKENLRRVAHREPEDAG